MIPYALNVAITSYDDLYYVTVACGLSGAGLNEHLVRKLVSPSIVLPAVLSSQYCSHWSLVRQAPSR